MIRVDQSRDGKRGNCMTAVIASLFEFKLDDLASLRLESRGWERRLDDWLDGWLGNAAYLEFPYHREQLTLPAYGMCVLIGPSVRSRESHTDHAVVGELRRRGVVVVHDPHPSRAGLLKVRRLGVFVMKRP